MQQPPPKTKTPPQQIALKQQKRLMNHLWCMFCYIYNSIPFKNHWVKVQIIYNDAEIHVVWVEKDLFIKKAFYTFFFWAYSK
jgi:hypothetical protein